MAASMTAGLVLMTPLDPPPPLGLRTILFPATCKSQSLIPLSITSLSGWCS